MFRVIKESEYVDERQHCFLIQVDLTECGLKDTQKDLIENLIDSKRLNYSVCQANRHFICRVYDVRTNACLHLYLEKSARQPVYLPGPELNGNSSSSPPGSPITSPSHQVLGKPSRSCKKPKIQVSRPLLLLLPPL